MAVFSYNQSAQSVSSGSVAFASNNTLGNTLIAVHAGFNITLATSVTDSQGNTYTKLASVQNATAFLAVFVAFNCKSGANTITFNGGTVTGSSFNCIIAEYN